MSDQLTGNRTAGRLPAANASSNPRRISAAVQNRADTNYVILYTVINREGQPLTQAAMISKNFGVNAAMGSQCVNVRQDGFAKIASEAPALGVHRIETRDQIVPRFRQAIGSKQTKTLFEPTAAQPRTNAVSACLRSQGVGCACRD
jgi:hypothetical protein